jgi:hypothetical protein
MLRFASIHYREIVHSQVGNLSSLRIGDYRTYLDTIHRNAKRWCFFNALAPGAVFRPTVQND